MSDLFPVPTRMKEEPRPRWDQALVHWSDISSTETWVPLYVARGYPVEVKDVSFWVNTALVFDTTDYWTLKFYRQDYDNRNDLTFLQKISLAGRSIPVRMFPDLDFTPVSLRNAVLVVKLEKKNSGANLVGPVFLTEVM